MIRLLKVESRRFWIRRATWFLGIGLIAVLMFTAANTYFSIPSKAEIEQQQIEHDTWSKDWEDNKEANIADCEEQAAIRATMAEDEGYELDEWDLAQDCTVNPYTQDDYFWYGQNFVSDAYTSLNGISGLVFFALMIIASSLFAAEFTTGALSNWLTFEPRRLRVYFSKVGAATLNTIPLAAIAVVAFVASLWTAYSLAGAVTGVDGKYWVQLGWLGVRIIVLAAGVAAISSALAALSRHTVAAVAIVGAYLVAIDLPMYGLFPQRSPWLLSQNVLAFLENGSTYSYEACKVVSAKRVCEDIEGTISLVHASVFLAVVALVIILIGALVFRRRDVL